MYIVFDIGGTNLRLASSTDGKTIDGKVIFPTPQNFEEAIKLLELEISKLNEGQPITAIAGGIPAVLNKDKTEIINVANLPNWSGKNLVTKLAKMFNCPVQLENDAVLGALGEANFGAGQNIANFIYITIGTGIGGAWIINGAPVSGSYSFNIGHQIIDPSGPLCKACQLPGHWEAYIKHPDFKKYLTIGLYNTLLHWPTDTIILGGGLTLNRGWDMPSLQADLQELTKRQSKNIEIKISSLGDPAGLHGALALLNV